MYLKLRTSHLTQDSAAYGLLRSHLSGCHPLALADPPDCKKARERIVISNQSSPKVMRFGDKQNGPIKTYYFSLFSFLILFTISLSLLVLQISEKYSPVRFLFSTPFTWAKLKLQKAFSKKYNKNSRVPYGLQTVHTSVVLI